MERDSLSEIDLSDRVLPADPCAYSRGRVARAMIAVYRWLLSPLLVALMGPACRFEPTCSRYAEEAIARYGTARGGWRALKRLLRCRPGGGWGYDPVAVRRPPVGHESLDEFSPMPAPEASGAAEL
jgi:putative membrane protein insertion efficiency factor